MSVNPADSPVMGVLYGTDAMRDAMGERAFLQRMLEVEAALARAQARLGIVPSDAAEAITRAAKVDRLDLQALGAATRNTGYPVVGLVKQLTALAGEDAGRWTHWGATTQDIMDTAVMLQMRQGLDLIRGELLATNAGFARMAREHRDTLMAGRTHLQHALPVTFGYKVAVWLAPLLTMVERLDQMRPRVERLQFGGAAGTLASLGNQGLAVQRELATELGLALPDIPWHVARDGIGEAVCFLGLLCGALSKIATDVMLMMQTELGEVNEPHVFGRGGSSTMPQKRNPIACEYILAQSRGVHALVPQVLAAMAQDLERGTGPWQAEALAIGQCFNLAHGALAQARFLAEGLVVDPARMRRNLDATGGLIAGEQVMMGLAPVLGRGEAHHVVNRACDTAIARGIPLARALEEEPEVASRIERDRIAELCDPANYLGSAGAFVDQVLRRAD
ncbi:3-carboxy-cis,cis-muconate cycloisomerase [Sabulicella glaciei]|uniref:3-carboxy-cis,cis-muconate cycloisomerase n=1 Tax=Sabulicella glaciei TaxID=2984948 RepID=A0ABT3NQK3_9PROT|nr:3-carboxy-cis,cis-muconate cycloisomerase [Roseococcus sp. MDT2-1-1]MCW8084430.1 3-carboxy-cis,cis-muconate cycloisomerase [Roseococcus sp. MDT2-1-1]